MHIFAVVYQHLFPAKMPTPDYSKAKPPALVPPGPTCREKCEFIRQNYNKEIAQFPGLTFSLDNCQPINFRASVAHHSKINLTLAIHPDTKTVLSPISRTDFSPAPQPPNLPAVSDLETTLFPDISRPQITEATFASQSTVEVAAHSSPRAPSLPSEAVPSTKSRKRVRQLSNQPRIAHIAFPLTVASLSSSISFASTCHAYQDNYSSSLPGSCYLQAFHPKPGVWSSIYKTFGPAPGPTVLLTALVTNFWHVRGNFILLPGHLQLVPNFHYGPVLVLIMATVEVHSWYNVIKLIRRPKSWKMRIVEAWALGAIDLAVLLFGFYKTIY